MNSNTARATAPDPKQDGTIDIEEYGKAGKVPPAAARYRIRVDKQKYDVEMSGMTGRELLELAGKRPAERYRIDMKLHGGQTRHVPLGERADFTTPGLERFMTLPLDQTEG